MIFIETRNGGLSRVRKEPDSVVAVTVLIPSELKTEAASYANSRSVCTALPNRQQYEFIDMCFVNRLSVAKLCGRGASWKSFRSRNLGGKFGN